MLNNELKKNPFAVPDKYFDSLPSKVQDKCIMAKKSTVHGLIPKLVWSGGIAVIALAFFLSYFNSTSNKKQKPALQTVSVENDRDIAPKSGYSNKHSNMYRDAKVDYLAVRNVNLNDYLGSKY
jgi:hypothetical protein